MRNGAHPSRSSCATRAWDSAWHCSRASALDRRRVAEVLAEVDLPGELVDEAHDRVLAKRTASLQRTRRRWLLGALVGGASLCLLSIGAWATSRAALIGKIQAQGAQVSLGEKGPVPTAFRAADRPDVFYTVTLANAPTGQTLDVRCDYRDPTGNVARHHLHHQDHQDPRLGDALPLRAPRLGSGWRVERRNDGREQSPPPRGLPRRMTRATDA